jgi:hypothetical protein
MRGIPYGSPSRGGIVERLLGSKEGVCCKESRAANTIVFIVSVCGSVRTLFRDLLFHFAVEVNQTHPKLISSLQTVILSGINKSENIQLFF